MNNKLNTNVHEIFMSRAIELAKKGRGHVSPNPMVGCILVLDGEIIGEGYHGKFGSHHAEVMAIRNARKDPLDAIAYINLEPCCISGKTPPCTNVLKENGISEVYIGMLDPNPEVYGKGVSELERAGILVHVGILEKESIELNKPFSKWITTAVPYVLAKVAQSADGYMGKNSETSIWITGDESRKHCHELRSKVDAVLVGKNTAVVDNPSLTVREIVGNNPKRIILDTNRTLPLNLNVFNDKKAETIVLCSKNKFDKTNTHFCSYIPVEEKNNQLCPHSILTTLAKEGITSLLIEGGQKTLKSFLDANTIDQMFVYTAPDELEGGQLENPIQLSDEWNILEEQYLGKDKLVIKEREVECLQEL